MCVTCRCEIWDQAEKNCVCWKCEMEYQEERCRDSVFRKVRGNCGIGDPGQVGCRGTVCTWYVWDKGTRRSGVVALYVSGTYGVRGPGGAV